MFSRRNLKMWLIMGLSFVFLIACIGGFAVNVVVGGILLGCSVLIFIWGLSIPFRRAGYTKKSKTARKRGIFAIGLGLIIIGIGVACNLALANAGFIWYGIFLVGGWFVLIGLWMLISGKGKEESSDIKEVGRKEKIQKELAKQSESGVVKRDALMTKSIQCPICKSDTILRTMKKGRNTGKEFHVCTKYPECKGRIQIRKKAL